MNNTDIKKITKSLWFKPLPQHPVVELSSSLHLGPAALVSIMILRPVKCGSNAQQKQALNGSKIFILAVYFW